MNFVQKNLKIDASLLLGGNEIYNHLNQPFHIFLFSWLFFAINKLSETLICFYLKHFILLSIISNDLSHKSRTNFKQDCELLSKHVQQHIYFWLFHELIHIYDIKPNSRSICTKILYVYIKKKYFQLVLKLPSLFDFLSVTQVAKYP